MLSLSRRARLGLSGATVGLVLSGTNRGAHEREIGLIEGVLVDDPPSEAGVIEADGERIDSVQLIQRLLEHARNSDVERRTWETHVATYEKVTVDSSDVAAVAQQQYWTNFHSMRERTDIPRKRTFEMANWLSHAIRLRRLIPDVRNHAGREE